MGQLTLHPIKVTRLEAWKNNNKQANKQKQKNYSKTNKANGNLTTIHVL